MHCIASYYSNTTPCLYPHSWTWNGQLEAFTTFIESLKVEKWHYAALKFDFSGLTAFTVSSSGFQIHVCCCSWVSSHSTYAVFIWTNFNIMNTVTRNHVLLERFSMESKRPYEQHGTILSWQLVFCAKTKQKKPTWKPPIPSEDYNVAVKLGCISDNAAVIIYGNTCEGEYAASSTSYLCLNKLCSRNTI